jgi:hypothetical protein
MLIKLRIPSEPVAKGTHWKAWHKQKTEGKVVGKHIFRTVFFPPLKNMDFMPRAKSEWQFGKDEAGGKNSGFFRKKILIKDNFLSGHIRYARGAELNESSMSRRVPIPNFTTCNSVSPKPKVNTCNSVIPKPNFKTCHSVIPKTNFNACNYVIP